ncbi:thiamine ABC transporter substrate-binding protein [Geotoga petraea]|uniref:Thiamine ABC transporter substrate-binding protein n=1 Tax=Geotoga petraea TaxID=28234 RepID=A0A4Z0W2U5_9BACT|nr:thiamine ABC transporter substrate-binding protein [Geotoga petraea]MDK2945933.1 thiamine transport system substrate-binding protein [Geotoga sp.]TGG88837.1 thiamine ABC transporter substrate-binding protein [Geotoga petraea]
MRRILFLAMLIFSLVSFSALTVYTYESMGWIEDSVISEFEDMYSVDVKVVKLGDGGNVLSRIKLEKRNPKADVVIGLDQSLVVEAVKNDLLISYKPLNASKIENQDIVFNQNYFVTPYDYGAIAIIYDPERLDTTPKTFEDLTKMDKSLIIQDPRSSSTGQAFLLWTIAIYGEDWKEFWKELKPAILTVTTGWTDSFSKFEAGEAPMMVSYATDGAYSYEYYESTKYKALIPEEGGYVQVEGAGIVKGTKNEDLAKRFIEFLLMDEFQKKVPLNQWMFPVTNVELPESYEYALKPEKILTIESEEIANNLNKWLNEWEELMY